MRQCTLPNSGIHAGNLILVNSRYQYREPEPPNLVPIGETGPQVKLNRRAAALFSELMQKIGGYGQIVPVSGFRTRKEQQAIWDGSLRENGGAFTRKYVAAPGHSEHETGLAIDLGLRKDKIDFIRPDFPYNGICDIFRENAAKYGFIERYPAGKESVTNIGHEPWHFRYVGVPHALVMRENGLTLEEYIGALRGCPYGKQPLCYQNNGLCAAVSYLRASRGKTTAFEIEADLPYSVSGDNIEGFVITEWRGAHERQK